jgi:hypothetical protein
LGAADRRLSGRRNVDQLETFLPRCVAETVVERDNLKRWRTSFGRNERRRKLQCGAALSG